MTEVRRGYRASVRRPRAVSVAALAGILVAALLTAVLALVTGGPPGTVNQYSWRIDAINAVGNVDSAVATMELALQRDTDLFSPYLHVVAVQQEQNAGKQAQKLSARQPPNYDLGRADRVTSALDNAQTLLTNVRIAIVRGDTASYAALIHNLQQADEALAKLESALQASPDEPGES